MKLLLAASVLLVLGDIAAAQNCAAITETSHTYDFSTDNVQHQLNAHERVVFKTPSSISIYPGSSRAELTAKFNVPRGNEYFALCTHDNHPDMDVWVTTEGQFPRRINDLPTNFRFEGGDGDNEIKLDFSLNAMNYGFTCEIEVRSTRCGGNDPARATPSPNTGRTCNCGVVNRRQRIIGGRNADVGEYPWMVHVLAKYENGPESSYFGCGGSIITEEYILTAAHCVPGQMFDQGRFIGHLREVSILVNSVDKNDRHSIYAENVISHGGYTEQPITNDIALLKVPRLDFAALNLGAVCMPPPNVDFQGMDSWAIGWGMINSQGDTGNRLQEIQMRVATDAHCKANWHDYNPTQKICNEFRFEEGSCKGDSGGPLTVDMDNHFYQAGIVSYGDDQTCNRGKVGIYTRVSGYLDWIKNTITRNGQSPPCSI